MTEKKQYPKNYLLSDAVMENGYIKLSPEEIEQALKNGALANVRDEDGKTPMMRAKDSPQMAVLKKYNASVNDCDNNGQSVLHHANTVDKVRFLIAQEELDVSKRDRWNKTALDWFKWDVNKGHTGQKSEYEQIIQLIDNAIKSKPRIVMRRSCVTTDYDGRGRS